MDIVASLIPPLIAMWEWSSTMPGITQASVASMTTVSDDGTVNACPIAAMRPSRTSTSVRSSVPFAIVRTVPFRRRTVPPVRVSGTRSTSVSTGSAAVAATTLGREPSGVDSSSRGSDGDTSSAASVLESTSYLTPLTMTHRTRPMSSASGPSTSVTLPILPTSSEPSSRSTPSNAAGATVSARSAASTGSPDAMT